MRDLLFKIVPLVAVATACVASVGHEPGLATAAGPASRHWTVHLGKGVGPWKVGMKLSVRPGLVAIERFPENDSKFGCTAISRIDYYHGIRVSWQFAPNAAHSSLISVATSRRGDRSAEGFVIGKTRLRTILARHPQRPRHPRWLGSLGLTEVTVERSTGYERSQWLSYWFDSADLLSSIETRVGGC